MLILEECRKRVVRTLSRERDGYDAVITWRRFLPEAENHPEITPRRRLSLRACLANIEIILETLISSF